MKSTTPSAAPGQAIAPIVVVVLTRASLPPVPDMLIPPVRSAAGSGLPTAPPLASTMRKYFPGWMVVPAGMFVLFVHEVPVLDAYCTDHPPMSTATVPRLKSSMKSFV